MNTYTLWENDEFDISTPKNPHITYSEGLHLIVATKKHISASWDDPELAGKAFELASETCKIMKELNLAPWFNLQANGNWGLLPGNEPFFHIHIYGRNKTSNWGKPVILPELPRTYSHDPMPETERSILNKVLKEKLV